MPKCHLLSKWLFGYNKSWKGLHITVTKEKNEEIKFIVIGCRFSRLRK